MTTTKKHPPLATSNQEDKAEAKGAGEMAKDQQKRVIEQATKPSGTKPTSRSTSNVKNITSYMEKQQVSTSSSRGDKRITEKERKTEDVEGKKKLQVSLSRAQANLDKVTKRREKPLKPDQKELSAAPTKAA
jgi:hypothetical protein